MSCFINQFSPLRTTTLCNVYVLSNESSTSKRVSLSKNNLGFLINEDVLSVTEYFQELINYPATVEKGKKQKKKKKWQYILIRIADGVTCDHTHCHAISEF